MVFEFESRGVRYKIEDTAAFGIGSVIVLPNGNPVNVTGWNKKFPMGPIVEEVLDAPVHERGEELKVNHALRRMGSWWYLSSSSTRCCFSR